VAGAPKDGGARTGAGMDPGIGDGSGGGNGTTVAAVGAVGGYTCTGEGPASGACGTGAAANTGVRDAAGLVTADAGGTAGMNGATVGDGANWAARSGRTSHVPAGAELSGFSAGAGGGSE